MPSLTGVSVLGRQVLGTLPNNITSAILYMPAAVISPPIRYGRVNVDFPYGGTNFPLWDTKALYGNGIIWLGIPGANTYQRRFTVFWEVKNVGWRLDY